MSDYPEGPGWWQASDQKWYPPESFPSDAPAQQPQPTTPPAYGQPPAAAQPPGIPPGQGIPPAPGAAGYPGGPGGYGEAPAQKTNGLAIASMIVSIVSGLILCVGWVFGIVGAILGHVALGQINKSGGTEGGRGLAIAGIVIGWIVFGLFVVFMAIGLLADDSNSTWTFE